MKFNELQTLKVEINGVNIDKRTTTIPMNIGEMRQGRMVGST